MFVRYRKVKNGSTRVQIVENYRVGNKAKIIEMTLNSSGVRDIGRVLRISKDTVTSELKKNFGDVIIRLKSLSLRKKYDSQRRLKVFPLSK